MYLPVLATFAHVYTLLQHLVTHYDHVEHKLFSDAREAEAQRKKQSQVVIKMQDELEQLKRDNAKRLKVRMALVVVDIIILK